MTKSYEPGVERARRIYNTFKDKEYNNHYTVKRLYAEVLRATAKDFPKFNTAERPNDWENGYHTVINTLHEIAHEFEELDKQPYPKLYDDHSDPYGGH